MKSTELMIYDWVQGFVQDANAQVMETGWTGAVRIITRNGTEILLNEADIQPIPLSPEILEKNGWGCLPDEPLYDWWSWRHNGCMLYLNLCGDTAEIEIFGREIYIHSVHELQHCLRLCGLTDLADNFKVE